MKTFGRRYNAAGKPIDLGVSYVWPKLSRFHRNVIRRNYRWMRQDGMTPTVARLVLASTLNAVGDSPLMHGFEPAHTAALTALPTGGNAHRR